MPYTRSDDREVYSVSQLNAEARILLESGFGTVWVEGELSNVARPSSGHIYFTLKDADAQVRCAMFRQHGYRLGLRPEDGLQVLVRARVSIYQARGDYQLIVEHLEEAGDGALRRAFEELKQQLAAEGLFDAEHKRPLPAFPRQVGVITSPSGAAVRDILTTLKRRFPALPVIVYPVPVQGEGVEKQIARIIALADKRRECDVLILARGGGSLEDLQAFNTEVVARAIFSCNTPMVVGVGHEIDFTIADFVADQRAPTPTAAAELVSPNRDEWIATLQQYATQLSRRTETHLQRSQQNLTWLTSRFQQTHPGRRLMERAQRTDELERRLQRAQRVFLRDRTARIENTKARLLLWDPDKLLDRNRLRYQYLAQRLHAALRRAVVGHTQALQGLARALNAVSPLATLERGYAIVSHEKDGQIVRRWNEAEIGERVRAHLRHGQLICRVEHHIAED